MAAGSWTAASLLSVLLWLQWAHLIFAHEAHVSVKGHRGFRTPRSHEEEDVFANNHLVSFSWKDPLLQENLWAGLPPFAPREKLTERSLLSKRAGLRKIIPKVPRSLHCLGCLKKAVGGQMTLAELNTAWLEEHIIPTEAQMRDKCVFYTGVKNSDRPNAPWLNANENLSPTAAQWACGNQLYSLWTLFPGRDSNVAPNVPNDGISKRNFWEIDVPGSWLNHISAPPGRFTYFENMSRAMANKCSGKVFIMSLDPEHTATYGTGTVADNNAHSIWNSVEVIALRNKGKTTQLVGIHAGSRQAYNLRLSDLVSLGPYTGPVPRAIEDLLTERDTCNGNLLYQNSGEDWFGTGRNSRA